MLNTAKVVVRSISEALWLQVLVRCRVNKPERGMKNTSLFAYKYPFIRQGR